MDNVFSISSDDYPDAFTWTGLGVIGKVVLTLSEAFGDEEISSGIYNCRLVLYDAVNTGGIPWDTVIQIKVYDY